MEGDAGTRQLNPTDADETPDESVAVSTESGVQEGDVDHRASRRGRRRRVGRRGSVAAGCWHLCGAGGVGRRRRPSAGISRCVTTTKVRPSRAVRRRPLRAAKDCVAATHAPDTAAMTASQAKIIECSTGDFGAQAALYSGVLVDAYQAANVTVQVSDMRAAVERHNDDGSVDVLVAVRVKVTNSEARGSGAGLPAAGPDGAGDGHVQDRQTRPGHS